MRSLFLIFRSCLKRYNTVVSTSALASRIDNQGDNLGIHPICAPLAKGGPAALAEKYRVVHEKKFIDECHFCYLVRRALISQFPQYLAPKQVYGL